MAHKMQAAVVTAFGKPLEFRELDIPVPGPGEILITTESREHAASRRVFC